MTKKRKNSSKIQKMILIKMMIKMIKMKMMMTKKVGDLIERRVKRIKIKKGRRERLEREYTNILMMKHMSPVLTNKNRMMIMQMQN